MQRREFLTAGVAGAAAAGVLAAPAQAVKPQMMGFGRNVLEFGVEAGSSRDQTSALQKAVYECAAAGQPAFLPPGRYGVTSLKLPANTALFGVPGATLLAGTGQATTIVAEGAKQVRLSGLSLDNGADGVRRDLPPPAIGMTDCDVHLDGVSISRVWGSGLALRDCAGQITQMSVQSAYLTGIEARRCGQLIIRDCIISDCSVNGISAGIISGSAAQVLQNRVSGAGQTGIEVSGDAQITANYIEQSGAFGLRLGSEQALGTFTAINNVIRGAGIGIGVSASGGGYGFISLNLITGARDGAIRALDGGKPIGSDLAKSSPEAFRNLGIAGNVAL
jgi:hypothetical protein